VRRVPLSCFALLVLFSAVPRALGPVFTFCAPRLVFGGTGGFGSHFHVLRTDSFSVVPRASHPVFMFSAPGLIFGGTEGVGSRFLIFCTPTGFRRFRERRVPYSCFELPESFSAVPSASGPDFMFCAPRLDFGGTEGVGSLFHVLHSLSHFRRYRWR
jgi:hypothetical protein